MSTAKEHIGGGLTWTGGIPTREGDVMGVAASYIQTGADRALLHGQELATEAFYRCRLTRFLSVKPDLQWVHSPAESRRGECVVATLQVVIDF